MEYYTINEIMEIIHVDLAKLSQYIRKGYLQTCVINGKVKISAESLKHFQQLNIPRDEEATKKRKYETKALKANRKLIYQSRINRRKG